MNLKYFFFDFDDNILHLDTKILMEYNNKGEWTPIEVSTAEYAIIRYDENYRIPHDENGLPDYETAYSNFTDIEGRECVFLKDCKDAIDNNSFAPSYQAFKKCIINGNHLFIVTARGHESKTIQRVIKYLIEHFTDSEKEEMIRNLIKFNDIYQKKFNGEILEEIGEGLLDDYLNECQYIGVTSKSFVQSIKQEEIPDGVDYKISKTEIGKQIAINRFIDQCVFNGNRLGDRLNSISIGFSDDDLKNVEIIKETFSKLKIKYPHVKFVVYDTSKKIDGSTNYNKIVI